MLEQCDRCKFIVYGHGCQRGVIDREWGPERQLIRYKCPQCSLIWTITWSRINEPQTVTG